MLEIGPSAIISALSAVIGIELAQFGYLWRMNERTVKNEERSRDNEDTLEKLGRRRGERPTPTPEMAD